MSRRKPKPPTTQSAQRDAKPEPKHWLDKATALFVLLAMIATGFAAWYTRQQWLTATDNETNQLRAYIGPVHDSYRVICPNCFDNAEHDDFSYENSVIYVLKNYGTTPARHALICGGFEPITSDMPAAKARDSIFGCNYSQIGERADWSETTFWPSEERKQVAAIGSLKAMKEVIRGATHGYLFVRVRYSDIFGTEHNTYFCRMYKGNPSDTQHGVGMLSGCGNVTIPQDD